MYADAAAFRMALEQRLKDRADGDGARLAKVLCLVARTTSETIRRAIEAETLRRSASVRRSAPWSGSDGCHTAW